VQIALLESTQEERKNSMKHSVELSSITSEEDIFTHRKAKQFMRYTERLLALSRKEPTPQVVRAMKRELGI
jgi:ribosomal protein L17